MKKTVLKVWTGNIWEALYPETSADCVKMSDGQSVEAVLNTLAAFNPSEYVKKTDYAKIDKYGLIKLGYSNSGLALDSSGSLKLAPADVSSITAKDINKSGNRCIPAYLIDDAVKVGVTTNTISLTDTEKTAACGWIGAVQDKSGESLKSAVYTLDSTGKNSMVSYADRLSAVANGSIPMYMATASNLSNYELKAALWTATPQYNYQCANKKYVDDTVANVATGGTIDLSNYVQKSTTYPDLLAVYGRGTQTQGFPEQLFTLSYTPSWGSLVRWGDPSNIGADNGTNYDSATICCPNPKQPYQTANKKYVDEELEDKLSGISELYEHIVHMTVESQEHDQIELSIRFLSASSESFGDGEFLLEELVNAIHFTIRPLLIDDASYLGIGTISNLIDMWYNPNDGTLTITTIGVTSSYGVEYRILNQIISYDYEVTPYGEMV